MLERQNPVFDQPKTAAFAERSAAGCSMKSLARAKPVCGARYPYEEGASHVVENVDHNIRHSDAGRNLSSATEFGPGHRLHLVRRLQLGRSRPRAVRAVQCQLRDALPMELHDNVYWWAGP